MNIESRLASFHAFEKGKQNKIDSVREAILSDAGQEWVRVEVEDSYVKSDEFIIQQVQIEDRNYFLRTQKDLGDYDEDGVEEDHSFYFWLYESEDIALEGSHEDEDGKLFEMGASFDYDLGNVVTHIQKLDVQRRLPKGFGLEMYQVLFELIQNETDRNGTSFTHEVHRQTDISENPMSNDRWNEIFSPTLKDAGYIESDQVGVDWEKRYQPQKDR